MDLLETAFKVTICGGSQGMKAFVAVPRLINVARTAFWTLCVCAYSFGIWCTPALVFDLRLLHFEFDFYNHAFANWPKESYFAAAMYEITSLAMIPFIICLWRSLPVVVFGLGVWFFEVFWYYQPLLFL